MIQFCIGITKPNVYGGRMSMYGEPVPAKDLDYFARKPVQGPNLEKLEVSEEGAVEILQQTLLRKIYHELNNSIFIIDLKPINIRGLEPLLSSSEKFMHSIELKTIFHEY